MYIYIYILHVYIYIYIYTCIHCTCVYIYIYIYTRVCVIHYDYHYYFYCYCPFHCYHYLWEGTHGSDGICSIRVSKSQCRSISNVVYVIYDRCVVLSICTPHSTTVRPILESSIWKNGLSPWEI